VRKTVAGKYQYVGCIHMHTTESDGTKVLEDVVEIGRSVGLEFMLFADHMNMNNRDNGKEGFYGDTLVLVGYEHNDLKDHHHYLLFGAPRVYPKDYTPKQYVAAGAKDGALGIMAHPDEIRDALPEHPPYPWTDWEVEGFDGLELWNQMSEWTEKLTRFNKLVMAFSPRKSMVGPTQRILKKWDELNLVKRTVGIGSVDAHAFPIKVGPLNVEIFPYKVHFRSIRCYLLYNEERATDFEQARDQLYQTIRDCRLYFANVRWGDAEAFRFWIEAEGREATCGESIPFEEGLKIKADIPSVANLRLVKNGSLIYEGKGDKLDQPIASTGIYRLEVFKGSRGWIFTNHIRVV